MTNTQRGILILIKAALTGKAPGELPPDFDIAEAYKEIRRHQIVPMAYTGAVLCGVPKDHPAMQQMFHIYLQQMMYSERQMAAVNKIFKAFDDHGIDYLPLKGSTLKSLYPKPEYRLMGDADILIKTDQYPQIETAMESINFTFKGESDHELIWESPQLYVELHKRLIPSYNKDYYAYYGDGWQLTKPADNSHHTFKSHEDEFIFIFTHFAKHYREGGVGIRQILDIYIYRLHHQDMDEQYIIEVLTKLQLQDFYTNTLATLDVWFENSPCNARADLITEYIFASGSWGNMQSHLMANMIKAQQTSGTAKSSKIKDFLHRAFPSRETMTYMYPRLKNDPYLLPVYYGVRIITTVFCRRELFNKKMEAYKASTDESIQTFQESLDYVGLRFNFKDE